MEQQINQLLITFPYLTRAEAEEMLLIEIALTAGWFEQV